MFDHKKVCTFFIIFIILLISYILKLIIRLANNRYHAFNIIQHKRGTINKKYQLVKLN